MPRTKVDFIESYFGVRWLIANAIICGALTLSPLWLYGLFARRQRGLTIRDYFLIMTAVAAAFGFNHYEYTHLLMPGGEAQAAYSPLKSPLKCRELTEQIPALCAIATLAAAVMWSVGPTVGWLARHWTRQSGLSRSAEV